LNVKAEKRKSVTGVRVIGRLYAAVSAAGSWLEERDVG